MSDNNIINHPKSVLFELIAKSKNISKPNFNFSQELIKDKNIINFTCSTNIIINNNNINFNSAIHHTKKEAEKEVCKHILEYLHQNNRLTSNVPNITHISNNIKNNEQDIINNIILNDNINSLIIIDHDNVSKDSDILKLENFVKVKMNNISFIIKISSYISSTKNTADIIVRSSRKDAVDHYISYLIGKINGIFELNKRSIKIYIITRDKFGGCLHDFVVNVMHNVDVNDFILQFSQ